MMAEETKKLGKYEIRRELGRGAMGIVYEGYDPMIDRRVALKTVRKDQLERTEAEEILSRFRREAQAAGRLNHPNVVNVYEYGEDPDGTAFIAMEYVDGRELKDYFDQHERFALSEIVRIMGEILGALGHAHQHGIVHRDIKPSNILVDASGNPKLLDFGIAKLLDEEEGATRSAYVPLTPGYAAPEQYAGGVITTATDVYALGILLHELLLGERPKLEPTLRRASSRVAELSTDLWLLPLSRTALRTALKGDIDNVLSTALEAEAGRRYASAGALADDINRYLDAQPVLAHPPSRWYRARKFVQRHRGGVAVSAALALAVIASLGIALWQARHAQIQAQRATSVRDFVLDLFDAAKDQLPRDVRPTPDVLARAAVRKIDANQSLDAQTRAQFLSTLGAISQTSSDYALAREFADRALAALDVGSALTLRARGHGGWALADAAGVEVGRMSSKFQPPAGTIVAVRVAAMLVRQARESEQGVVKCASWELVLPEFEYVPASAARP